MTKARNKVDEKRHDKTYNRDREPDQKSRNKAEAYLKDPEKAEDLLRKAHTKMEGKNSGPLKDVWQSLSALCRLVKCYLNGEYRETPWYSLMMIVAAIVYFVSPIDAVPDAIPLLGFIDDAGVLAWTAKTFKVDIDAFISWEAEQNSTAG